MKSIEEQGGESNLNKVCAGAHSEYNGANICAYNVARAFTDAKHFLVTNISKRKEDWQWGKYLHEK